MLITGQISILYQNSSRNLKTVERVEDYVYAMKRKKNKNKKSKATNQQQLSDEKNIIFLKSTVA